MGRKREETAMDITDSHEIEAQKKNKHKKEAKRKRKLGETEPEVVAGVKKEKKKKKEEKREKGEEILNTGSVLDCAKGNEISNGSDEVGEKKNVNKHKREKEQEGLEDGFVIDNGSTEKCDENNKNGVIVDGEERKNDVGAVVSGKDIKESQYPALKSVVESGLPKDVLECCKNFDKPSPIQSHSWPFLLNGRDFIGIAATGSGKTLAFGVPAIMHVLQKRQNKTSKRVNPLCLVLSPTRELVQQISDDLCDAGKPCGLQSVCLYGGTSKGPQTFALKSGVDIVIGTPGRMKDLIEMGICYLKEVSFVLTKFVIRILSLTCSALGSRQMVMFSATWPPAVHQLAQEFMDPNPVKVVVGSEDLAANHDVMQIVEVLDDRAHDELLVSLLEKYHKSQRNRILVFVLYKKEAARVETMLQKRGWKVVSIHGDKAQHARTKVLSLFKEGSCPLMVCGLDIPDVEVVINYSFPLTTEDNVHRIGRTGRAGKKGGLAGELVNVLREAGQTVPAALINFGTHVKKKEMEGVGGGFL
ncbi:DEAD-box ATP-dependent RNA helicase 5 [Camellia lanceoleosa]|uniref:DEAD-box ATP-dependent RNA helicase 5 n=1 Tax=Camellia lanceoleosa TaxID=1840588 RepID=A0ACC0I999_9ERIC|nr:DEAD-box ATP-dependent RNA helicase 5 [Camellia lanceoleosa]